jgi:hypothetical protein
MHFILGKDDLRFQLKRSVGNVHGVGPRSGVVSYDSVKQKMSNTTHGHATG